MTIPKICSTVTVNYIGTLDNGRIFDSTEEHGPLTFTIGSNQVFPALEQSIVGMRPGEAKNIVLSADDAYGPRMREPHHCLQTNLSSGQRAHCWSKVEH